MKLWPVVTRFKELDTLHSNVQPTATNVKLHLLFDNNVYVNAPRSEQWFDICKSLNEKDGYDVLLTPVQQSSLAIKVELIQIFISEGADINICLWKQQVEGDFCESIEDNGLTLTCRPWYKTKTQSWSASFYMLEPRSMR